MTIDQMKYFVTAAKCLNFTKAAEILFITQPALSRQIANIEQELNMQLFVRTNRQVRLTPPAEILLEKFEKLYNDYNIAVADAQNSFQGLSGELSVGVLEGAYLGDLFPGVLKYFDEYYPNVKINLRTYSFNKLINKLYENELDIIFTLLFDLKSREMLKYKVIEKTCDHIVVHKDHRLAQAKFVKLSDFKDDTLIIVSEEDSEESARLIIDACKKEGFTPKVRFASSLSELMLWVEAGVGVCILDTRNSLYGNSAVKFLDVAPLSDPSMTMAWNEAHYNPMKKVFIENFVPSVETENSSK